MNYIETIKSIDADINPVGVECSMRMEYGELDHLPFETFAQEVRIARGMEELEPGSLRALAESYGRGVEYERHDRSADG